jgi:very-short-patch-repair endonuclease
MLQEFWALVARQHGVVTREQLLALGFSSSAIQHRIATRRLHRVWHGVYAVGRPELSERGRWLAAALACGPKAVLSHGSAAALWGLGDHERGLIEVSVPSASVRKRAGLRVHRREQLGSEDIAELHGIRLTSPVRTLIDLAPRFTVAGIERAVNEAASLDLVLPDALRRALDDRAGQRGVARLRDVLDRRTFSLTRSELERRFLPIARSAGLPRPETRVRVNGFEVDFYWPCLRLVVETDGLRFHRTPAQQARDRLRDQAHTAAGLTPLRFTHAQVRYEPRYVRDLLETVAARTAS